MASTRPRHPVSPQQDLLPYSTKYPRGIYWVARVIKKKKIKCTDNKNKKQIMNNKNEYSKGKEMVQQSQSGPKLKMETETTKLKIR